MAKYKYQPIENAPKNGAPIIGVCGGVEMAVAYDDAPFMEAWVYWDEDDGGLTYERAKPQPLEWRPMF
jgi:hypothetical protein